MQKSSSENSEIVSIYKHKISETEARVLKQSSEIDCLRPFRNRQPELEKQMEELKQEISRHSSILNLISD